MASRRTPLAKSGRDSFNLTRPDDLAAHASNRPDTMLDALARLPPVFDATSGRGSVTAGNASQLADGASATLGMCVGGGQGAAALFERMESVASESCE